MITSLHVPELVDHVIDYLYDDVPSLQNASLVARQWRSSGQFHLFRHVSVQQDARLLQIRCGLRPELASHIRTLRLSNLNCTDVEVADALVHLCGIASQLEDLHIHASLLGNPFKHGSTRNTFEQDQRRRLHSLQFSSSFFQDADCWFPFVNVFSHVDVMTLRSIWCPPFVSQSQDTVAKNRDIYRNKLSVQQVRLIQVSPVMAMFLPAVVTKNSLRVLRTFYGRRQEQSLTQALCEDMGASIEEVHVTIDKDGEFSTLPPVQCLPRLRKLFLRSPQMLEDQNQSWIETVFELDCQPSLPLLELVQLDTRAPIAPLDPHSAEQALSTKPCTLACVASTPFSAPSRLLIRFEVIFNSPFTRARMMPRFIHPRGRAELLDTSPSWPLLFTV